MGKLKASPVETSQRTSNNEFVYEEVPQSQDIDPTLTEAPLNFDDVEWIENLGLSPVDGAVVEKLNQLLEIGRESIQHHSDKDVIKAVQQARIGFYANFGFTDPSHPIYKSFRIVQERNSLPSPGSFVAIQRLLHLHGIDANRYFALCPGTSFYTSPTKLHDTFAFLEGEKVKPSNVGNRNSRALGANIEEIREKFELLHSFGLDVERIVNIFPAILTYSNKRIESRYNGVQRVCTLLGWGVSAAELINKLPAIFGYSEKKLFVHARLFAKHGNPDVNGSEVAAHIIMPLEPQLHAVASSSLNWLKYSRLLAKTMNAEERKAKKTDILSDPRAYDGSLGRKVVQSYVRYKKN